MDMFSPWLYIVFLAFWYVLLILFDGTINLDESTRGMGEMSKATRKINFWQSLLNHGAAYAHTVKFERREVKYHNLKDDVGYTFALESQLLGNSSISSYVSSTKPDCVLNAYGVLCYKRVFDK